MFRFSVGDITNYSRIPTECFRLLVLRILEENRRDEVLNQVGAIRSIHPAAKVILAYIEKARSL